MNTHMNELNLWSCALAILLCSIAGPVAGTRPHISANEDEHETIVVQITSASRFDQSIASIGTSVIVLRDSVYLPGNPELGELDSLVLTEGTDTVYAVVVDSVGNFVKRTDIVWECIDTPSVATVTPVSPANGSFVVSQTGQATRCLFVVRDTASTATPDTIAVVTRVAGAFGQDLRRLASLRVRTITHGYCLNGRELAGQARAQASQCLWVPSDGGLLFRPLH